MTYDLFITPLGRINFAPDNEIIEILQNVYTIITTLKFTVPMDRDLGINASVLDLPLNHARENVKAQIVQAVRKFEPRAKIRRVDFEHNTDGKLLTHLKVEI